MPFPYMLIRRAQVREQMETIAMLAEANALLKEEKRSLVVKYDLLAQLAAKLRTPPPVPTVTEIEQPPSVEEADRRRARELREHESSTK